MKNFSSIQSTVISRCKIDPSNTTDIGLILSDANDACGIIASLKNWDELFKSANLTLLLADGDTVYSLASDVDKIETVTISTPTNYAVALQFALRKNILNIILQKTIGGTSQPNYWYFAPPTVSSDNVATKNISFNSMPDQSYTVTYNYYSTPPQITTGTNYPFFPSNYHYIVELYCEWKYCERNPDPTLNPDYFRGEWENGVKELTGNYASKLTENVPISGPNPYAG